MYGHGPRYYPITMDLLSWRARIAHLL